MAKKFSWDRATITPDEIVEGLITQYGVEQPITVEMDNRKEQISYASAMATFECHRCGATFNTTPKSLLNLYYSVGRPCIKCANLSDEDLKFRRKEEMNQKAIEVLKERGIDVTKEDLETEEDEKAKMEAEEDQRVAMSSEDYADAFEELSENEEFDQTEETPAEEPVEEEADDTSKYMVDDDESYSAPIENSVENTTDDDEARAKTALEISEEIFQDSEEQEIEDEEETVEEESNEESESDETSEEDNYEDDASEDYVVADTDDDDSKSTEDYIGYQEQEESQEETPAEEPVDEDAPVPFGYDFDDSEEEEAETEEEPIEYDQVVGSEGYSQEEFENICKIKVSEIKSKLGFNPWVVEKFDTDEDGHIKATCRQCGQETLLGSFNDLSDVIVIGRNFCKKHGLDQKENNSDESSPIMHKCNCCVESIVQNGYNEYHRKTIESIAKESHFTILNSEKHWFIPQTTEIFKVECNGVKSKMTFLEMIGLHGKDAREDPKFKKEDPEPEPTKSVESSPVKEEPVSAPVEDKTVLVAKPQEVKQEEKPAITIKPVYTEKAPKKQQEKVVLTAVHKEEAPKTEPKQETKPKQEQQTSPNQPKKIVLVAKPTHTETVEKDFSTSKTKTSAENKKDPMYEKYNKGPNVESAFDTNAALEEERAVENENIVKNTMFKASQKLLLSNKSIADISERTSNPFDREKDLKDQFNQTEMAKFISDLSEQTGVKCSLILSNRTYEIPVIDFESGIRIICADLNERSMPGVPLPQLGNKKYLPFVYKQKQAVDVGNGMYVQPPKEFKWTILYSDSVEARHDATFMALVKLINPKKLAYNGDKIRLDGNLNFEYTTNDQFLRDFDVRYSPFPGIKPKTGQLGIIASWNSKSQMTARDAFRLQNSINGLINVANLDTLADENSQYMVASIRYIEQYNKEINRAIYTITEYVEIGSCFVDDGLTQCIRALLKEYTIKYPEISNTPPYIIIECDPNNYTSPSIKSYIDLGTLEPMNDGMRQMMYGGAFKLGTVDQYLRYSYIRRPEYRVKDSDSYRQDMRMFTAGTLIRMMTDEVKQAGIQNTIRDTDVRLRFISNMGFIKAIQAEIKEYFVNQTTVTSLLYDYKTSMLKKHIDADGNFYQNTAMVTNSNSGIGINNIFTNPNLISRYQNIMERGTPEAKQVMMNALMQNNPMMAAQMQSMNGGQQQGFGVPNMMNVNPMMGFGMPNMFGK